MRKTAIAIILLLALTVLFSACSSSRQVELGTYTSDLDSFISLRLEKDNRFELNGPIGISTIVRGTYSIDDETLLLTADDKAETIFLFKNDSLIFESGAWFEHWVAPGTTFKLSDGQ